MELKQFLKVVRRSWWLVLGLPLAVLLFSLVTLRLPDPSYSLTAKIAVSQSVLTPTDSSVLDFNSYYSWAASEYVLDDLSQMIVSAAFVRDLQFWLSTQHSVEVPTDELQSSLSANRIHRILLVHVTADDPGKAHTIAEGVSVVLQERGLAYWDRRKEGGLDVELLEIGPAVAQNRWRQPVWGVVLRTTLGFAAGLFLAFVRHAMDPSIRDEQELEALGLNVVAAIPQETMESPKRTALRASPDVQLKARKS